MTTAAARRPPRGWRRPYGVGLGAGYLVFGWGATLGLALLTGAVAVVLMLGVGAAAAAASLVTGWWALRTARAATIDTAPTATATEPSAMHLTVTTRRGRPMRRAAHVRVFDRGESIASGWLHRGRLDTDAVFTRRGEVTDLEVVVTAAGLPGLIWWQRTLRATHPALLVAPHPAGPGARVEVLAADQLMVDATAMSGAMSTAGDVDGIRRWREGDADHAVHWPTSFRTGELNVFDHQHTVIERWVVRADPTAADTEIEAGRARWALDDGRRHGRQMWAAVADGEAVLVADAAAAARWTATCQLPPPWPTTRRHWGNTAIPFWREPDTTLSTRARWVIALVAAVGLLMLSDALGHSLTVRLAITAGCAVGAALTLAAAVRPRLRLVVRIAAVAVAVGGVLSVLQSLGEVDDVLSAIRGPMPQLLIVLIVLQGFECHDRRGGRVTLAFSAVTAAYAAALRVDDAVVWWLAAFALLWFLAAVWIGLPARRSRRQGRPTAKASGRRIAGIAAAALTAAAAAVLILNTVEIPDGPADLGLPASVETIRDIIEPGSLARPDGTPTRPGATGDRPRRGGDGTVGVGGYPGFDESMDTSMRGEMGDTVVMRVRAPEPDFWRGQTYSRFDGRLWYADPQQGEQRSPSDIAVGPAAGDVPEPAGVEVDEFIQTYYLSVDHPNAVFAAYRPTRVLIESSVWLRPDGAIRSDRVLTDGTVYTVVSARARVTTDALRRQGDLAALMPVDPVGMQADYLAVPPSTTERTRALAAQLAAGSPSTYDTIRRMEAWIAANVQYDLDAPVPPPGTDAVDELLFGSQRGFCEQIASSLAIMLRTIGVPTRVATGYVPGVRDRITGVWEVRASDAHAWVEVWFPATGWQAFDPTAGVPLAGEFDRASVGAEVTQAVVDAVREHGPTLARLAGMVVVGAGLTWLIGRQVLRAWRRRRRGRWGVLQDRWLGAAAARGLDPGCSNPELARRWPTAAPGAADSAAEAAELAELLDRVAFDPSFTDDDAEFLRAAALAERVLGRR